MNIGEEISNYLFMRYPCRAIELKTIKINPALKNPKGNK